MLTFMPCFPLARHHVWIYRAVGCVRHDFDRIKIAVVDLFQPNRLPDARCERVAASGSVVTVAFLPDVLRPLRSRSSAKTTGVFFHDCRAAVISNLLLCSFCNPSSNKREKTFFVLSLFAEVRQAQAHRRLILALSAQRGDAQHDDGHDIGEHFVQFLDRQIHAGGDVHMQDVQTAEENG